MTFEKWWTGNKKLLNEHQMTAMEAVATSSASAWLSATIAERKRCLEIVKEVASTSSIIGTGVANQIAEKIGE